MSFSPNWKVSRPWVVLAAILQGVLLAGAMAEGGGVCPDCPNTCQLRTSCETYTPFAVSLRWLKSAQFAGFYAAKALGYWEDECLGVSLRPATFENNPIDFEDLPADTRATIPHYM
jgi:ABC-type nitrate/sulfonate/bicarbonate transport system substrate-binding protein